ncbi:AP-4 complex subunit epsilon [Prunus yedoensis var. nudiflora]|uniref:AP-4 complex subunit epsilon n=1 Tax=Prunus yedoensis var. nudiflora TaxID=2094558 RepID=A0A314Y3V1_PRUYE|nr:AP-4 complex subunit epsilon [Prunus yedoensis var. nudiflora]
MQSNLHQVINGLSSRCHPFLTLNKVFEHAGDLVNVKVAHNLMKLIAEGFGEDDDSADSQLRSSATINN